MTAGSTPGRLVTILREMDESAKPWKLRPPEKSDDPARVLIGAQPELVRDHLEDAGYSIRDLDLPVESDGWVAAWAVSS